MKNKFDERKWMEGRGFEYIGKMEDFKIPKWWDCAWRRVSCQKDECRMCGKINQQRMRHIINGRDPDDMGVVMEDVGESFGEAFAMIKKHAEEMGIDITNINESELEEPPEPETFPLYNKVTKWHNGISDITKNADYNGSLWLLTEAAADLIWYKNTLLVKTCRQLDNRWHLDRGDEYGEVDYKYTKYVLGECLKILERSLTELSSIDFSGRDDLKRSLKQLMGLKKSLLSI